MCKIYSKILMLKDITNINSLYSNSFYINNLKTEVIYIYIYIYLIKNIKLKLVSLLIKNIMNVNFE